VDDARLYFGGAQVTDRPDVWIVMRDEPFQVHATTTDVEFARRVAAKAGDGARVWRICGLESYERWARDEAPPRQSEGEKGDHRT
jgi:hypothetical protein